MTRENPARDEEQRRPSDGTPEPKDGKNQGIVRDERGQEQPADKERAQRTSKTQ